MFNCTQCEKSFIDSSHLNKHQIAHNIDRKLPEKNHEDLSEKKDINVAAKNNQDQSPSFTSVIFELEDIMDSILEDEIK